MAKRTRSIRFNLFKTYAGLVILVAGLFVTAFYYYESTQLTRKTFESINDLSFSLSNKLDLEIQKLDNVTLSVAYSNLIKGQLAKLMDDQTEGEKGYTGEQVDNIKQLIEVMVAAIGPAQSIKQLIVYDLNGNRISSGALTSFTKERVQDQPWYEAVLASKGKNYFTLPEQDEELIGSFSWYKGMYLMSFFRTYYDSLFHVQGVIQT